MPGKHATRVFDLVVNYHSGDSFSNSLTPPNSLDRSTLATVGNEISIDYTTVFLLKYAELTQMEHRTFQLLLF